MNENKTKALIFARVSSREQEETGYSLDSQIKLLQDYAEGKFTVLRVFRVSESASGKQVRKLFNEMFQYATKNHIPIVLCEKIDRLTRNPKDAAVVDDWVKESKGREVHFIKESFVLNDKTKAHESLVWDMKVAIARFYTNNLSEEVLKGQKEKIAQGWLPTKPPIGYKTTGEKGHKTHLVDEKKASLVREMFELYSTGNHSTLSLVKTMHEKGLRNRAGGRVGKSRLHMLLSDPFYRGDIRWNGVITKGKHEPLISRQLFEKVQSVLCRKIKNPQYRKHLPIFKAKLHCEGCGGTITWEIQKGRWYGHCNHHLHCGQKKWVRQDQVEKELFPLFDRLVPKDERVLRWLEEALKEDHAEESTANTNKREEITRSIAIVEKRRAGAYLDKLDGVVDAALYQKVIEDTKKEKAALLEALEGLEEDQAAYYEAGFAIHELAAQAQKIYESPKTTVEEKRLLLSYIFSDIKLEEGIAKPNYTYAFDFLSAWIPKLNKNFEPQQNAAETVVSSGVLSASLASRALGPLGPRNDFRTPNKPSVKARFEYSYPQSRSLLRW